MFIAMVSFEVSLDGPTAFGSFWKRLARRGGVGP
jgi:hypothetical protein